MDGDRDDTDAKRKEDEEREQSEGSARQKLLALEALQILAFDGDDATTWQIWLKERLQAQLTSCDVCIRNYHYRKRQMKQRLEEYYCPVGFRVLFLLMLSKAL